MKTLKNITLLVVFNVSILFSHLLAADDSYAKGFEAAQNNDFSSAIAHWRPLAERGFPEAQFNLALIYHGGLGVAHNEAEALRLYHKSAENGHSLAQEYLAAGYTEGWFGLEKNKNKAEFWRKKVESK